MTEKTAAPDKKSQWTQTQKVRFTLGILLSALSGLLLLFSFPPFGLWPLIWIAIVPHRYAQYRLLPRERSSLAEATAMLLFLGPFMARLFTMEFGPFFYGLGVLIAILIFFINRERKFHEQTRFRWFLLSGVFGWVGFEMIRATFIPLVATSAFIGYTQSTQPWITQPVSIFSVYGLNLVIVLVNYAITLVVMALSDRKWDFEDTVPIDRRLVRNSLIATGVVLAAWFGTSAVLLNTTPVDQPTVRVAAIQPGYSIPAFQDEVNTSQIRLEAFAEQAREAAQQGAQILFTPEMLFNFDPQVENTEALKTLAAETNTYIFLDYSVAIEGQPWRNESVLLSPDGTFSAVYGKNEIPPGESPTLTAGVYPVFDTPWGKLGTMICHDANYTATTRKLAANGAQLVSSGLNEFGGFGEHFWTNVSFRAIENRAAMVVAARESGSAIINPDGSPVAVDFERGKQTILVGDVQLGTRNAPYTTLGDLLGWISMAVFVGFIVFQSLMDRKAKRASANQPITAA